MSAKSLCSCGTHDLRLLTEYSNDRDILSLKTVGCHQELCVLRRYVALSFVLRGYDALIFLYKTGFQESLYLI